MIWSTMISQNHFPVSANSLKPLTCDTGNVTMKFHTKLMFPALPVTNTSTSQTHPKLTKQHLPAQLSKALNGYLPMIPTPNLRVFTDHVAFQIPGIYLSAGTCNPRVKS